MGYRRELWEIAAGSHGVVTVLEAKDAGVPAVEVRKLAQRGVLSAYGNGVYVHHDIPTTELTQPAVAVALAGEGGFLQRESVLDLLRLGQFNPSRIRVATRRRVRRSFPGWVTLETRPDISEADLTQYESIPATTVRCALAEVRNEIPPDRWRDLVLQAHRRQLIDDLEVSELRVQARRAS